MYKEKDCELPRTMIMQNKNRIEMLFAANVLNILRRLSQSSDFILTTALNSCPYIRTWVHRYMAKIQM